MYFMALNFEINICVCHRVRYSKWQHFKPYVYRVVRAKRKKYKWFCLFSFSFTFSFWEISIWLTYESTKGNFHARVIRVGAFYRKLQINLILPLRCVSIPIIYSSFKLMVVISVCLKQFLRTQSTIENPRNVYPLLFILYTLTNSIIIITQIGFCIVSTNKCISIVRMLQCIHALMFFYFLSFPFVTRNK